MRRSTGHAPLLTTGTTTVPVVFALGGVSMALDVTVPAGAAVADLVTALAGGQIDAGHLVVDGQPFPPDALVAECAIHPGSRLELGGPGPSAVAPADPVVDLLVSGGIDAGAVVHLPAGRHVVGRSPDCDLRLDAATVSAHHAVLDVAPSGRVTVTDGLATNGVRIDGDFVVDATDIGDATLDLGAVQVRVRPHTPTSRRRPGPFNRPPRTTAEDPVAALRPPAAPNASPSRPRLSWTAITLPLLTGAVLAVVWDPRMAAFALFSPVLVVGNWWEEKRRSKRDDRTSARQLAEQVDAFRSALRDAMRAERARRERIAPDPAVLVDRARSDDPSLWQRRPEHRDAFVVRVGVGDEPWRPPLEDERVMAEAAADVLRREGTVSHAPILVDLGPGSVLGVVSRDREAAAAVARAVAFQLAVHLGPADLRLAIVTDDGSVDRWSPTAWLPHTLATGEAAGMRLVAACDADAATVAGAVLAMETTVALIVDAPHLLPGRTSPVRPVLAAPHVIGVVVAGDRETLPASCTHVLELEGAPSDGAATLTEPRSGRTVEGLLACGLDLEAADDAARALAAVDDVEAADRDGALPSTVDAASVLGADLSPGALVERWERHATTAPTTLPAPIGMTADGPLVFDLVADGPHALLGGTTGAGKSELLRTLVAGLAATVSPTRLNFVLVDYKGGSAFDACARLPHTVGVVTDLDEHLGQRALRCLEAELRHREAVLRACGAVDLVHHQALRPHEPLPRLLVVIDEFATMAAELPDFIDSLVGIAQRGRSLGVHLLLGTQRPAGAVKENIRANTNLRIALRMQDASDSNDVLGVPDAAAISRRIPGRGLARLGPGELVAFQAAHVSARAATTGEDTIVVRPRRFAPGDSARLGVSEADGPSELERVVDSAVTAASMLALAEPRRPWPDPLPESLELSELPPGAFALADDPSGQRRLVHGWSPEQGNVIVYGAPGSGTTTALESIAVAVARAFDPGDLHLYAIDFGAGRLSSLAELPHTGAVIGAAEPERQRRLVRFLRSELDRRRGSASLPAEPRIVVLLDGWSAFAAAFDDVDGMDTRDAFARVVADGPAVGITTVIAADHPNAVPMAIAGIVATKLALRLADRHDWSAFAVASKDAPAEIPGRGLDIATALEIQVARPGPAACTLARRGSRTARPIDALPSAVALDRVSGTSSDGDAWTVTFGVGDDALAPAGLVFHPCDHATITGPARSGRSTALVALARSAGVPVTAVALRRSPLRDVAGLVRVATSPADATAAIEAVLGAAGPHLVLVDDAESFDDDGGAIASLLRALRPDVHLVAAGRVDAIRAGYGHWTRELRRSRLGLALSPQPEDGDVFGAVFSRRLLPPPVPGRGLLVVDGRAEVFQVAQP